MESNVLVSGLDDYYCTDPNGTYTYFDIFNGKPRYQKPNRDDPVGTTDDVYWNGSQWEIFACGGDVLYFSTEDVAYPWLVTSWEIVNGSGTLVVTEYIPLSQPTFGLPADVVALITSRFGTVANFLRLRNQGQV